MIAGIAAAVVRLDLRRRLRLTVVPVAGRFDVHHRARMISLLLLLRRRRRRRVIGAPLAAIAAIGTLAAAAIGAIVVAVGGGLLAGTRLPAVAGARSRRGEGKRRGAQKHESDAPKQGWGPK